MNFRLVAVSACLSLCGSMVMAAGAAYADEIDFNRQWAEKAFNVKPGQMLQENKFTIIHEDGPGETKVGRCAAEGPLRLGKRIYNRGIGTNSHSVLRVTLSKPAARFIADIGLDRNVDNSVASAAFHINIGDKEIFATKVFRPNGEVQSIDVPLKGAKEFDLIVSNGGDDRTCDQGDWGDARVILQDGSEVWLDEIASQGDVNASLPFSFVCGGKHSSEFIYSWKSEVKEQKIDSATNRRTVTFTDPETGLEVKAVADIYLDTPGVDWTIYFTNTGTKDTPIIEQVKAVDISVKPSTGAEPVLHRLKGSTGCVAFTYDDYKPMDDAVKAGEKVEFGISNAFSSFDVSPFFNLEWGGGGVITAVGWSGHWGAVVENKKDGPLTLNAGMKLLHLKLHPGETIRGPRVMQLYWLGRDEWRAYNMFRQTMFEHVTPKNNGEPVMPPIAHMTSSFYEVNNTTEEVEKSYIDSIKDLGFEYYWLDAWWHGGGFPAGLGNYGYPISRVPDSKRFPNGLKPVGDYAHKNGMKFLAWFAPETASAGSLLTKEHPEWILTSDINAGGNFNLGNPEAREFMTGYLKTAIKEYGIDLLRIDIGPSLESWKSGDKDPDRVGMTEICYVDGLYRMLDDIRKAYPRLVIDNCCGGGTRIDLEMCSRSIPLWRTDGAVWSLFAKDSDKAAIQNQIISSGLNRYVPLSTSGQMGAEPYYFRSGFNGGTAFAEDTRVDGYPRAMLKQGVAEGKRIRKYFLGNFYPFTEVTENPKEWCVMQYHRPDAQDGMILAFRRQNSPYGSYTCELREIDPNAKYEVIRSRTYRQGKPTIMKGSDLQQIQVSIDEKPGSMLIEYRKVK
ncbi:MAG: NPCBM/NEW2 domain-containing protein [Armatimonadota bacterium]